MFSEFWPKPLTNILSLIYNKPLAFCFNVGNKILPQAS